MATLREVVGYLNDLYDMNLKEAKGENYAFNDTFRIDRLGNSLFHFRTKRGKIGESHSSQPEKVGDDFMKVTCRNKR
ncbi:hypothetical protein [Alkalihalobacillus sp. TS-13]|uniref:hypothetical protein n=1 Tax=Alkalihalobacillus sp. TS-13 TaxID=2842455 RepID=UPI001C8838E6|nr:hypothetical protein [Alkalihalobacillus sp. TS-13]